jgi:hypothetical protein
MTGELFANDQKVADLSRGIDQTWDDGYEFFSVPVLADQDGQLTLKLISTTTDRGGNILYDDIRLSEGGDAFLAWTVANQIANDPDGNSDGDPFTHEFDFLLNQDPRAFDPLIVPDLSGPQRLFAVPLNGAALLQGYTLSLKQAPRSAHGLTLQRLESPSSTTPRPQEPPAPAATLSQTTSIRSSSA